MAYAARHPIKTMKMLKQDQKEFDEQMKHPEKSMSGGKGKKETMSGNDGDESSQGKPEKKDKGTENASPGGGGSGGGKITK